MRIGEAKKILKEMAVRGGEIPIMLLGPPGIGKTAVVKEAAEEASKELGLIFVEYFKVMKDLELRKKVEEEREKYFVFREMRMSECLPEDFLGLPKKDDKDVKYIPLHWAKTLAEGPGMLFLDEANLLFEESKKAVMYKLLEKKVGDVKLHDKCSVILAGNPPEDVPLAEMLPSPVANRIFFVKVEANIVDWLEWAKENGIHRCVISFLEIHPELLFVKPPSGETLEQFPTPRSWEMASKMCYVVEKCPLSSKELKETFSGILGRKTGEVFAEFVEKVVSRDLSKALLEEAWKGTPLEVKKEWILKALSGERELVKNLLAIIEKPEGPEILMATVYEQLREGIKPFSREVYEELLKRIEEGDKRALRFGWILIKAYEEARMSDGN